MESCLSNKNASYIQKIGNVFLIFNIKLSQDSVAVPFLIVTLIPLGSLTYNLPQVTEDIEFDVKLSRIPELVVFAEHSMKNFHPN